MLIDAVASACGLGLLGGLHCAFMCGPIAVAACSGEGGPRARRAPAYFAGRLTAYAFAGALFGALGEHAAHQLSLPSLQLGLLALVAGAMVWRGVRLFVAARRPDDLVALRTRPPSRIGAQLASLLPRRALPLGLATGLLPCGLLASAWAIAAATARPADGALVMAAFSVATAPGLAAGLLAAAPLAKLRGRWSPAWQGALWCAFGIWIALRPLVAERLHHGCH